MAKTPSEPAAKPSSRSTATAQARKRLIAQAVIEILAREGSRALTHRRIDAHLGLPQGATSYYFPRWFELLKSGFNKLFEDSLEDFDRCYAPVVRRLEADQPIDVDLVAASAHRHWRSVTRSSRRDLAIARFEFYLLAAHDPKLMALQRERRRGLFDLTTAAFAALGCRNARRAAAEFSSRIQGDYISHFIAPSFSQPERTVADFAARIRQIATDSDAVPADRSPVPKIAPLIAI